MMKGHQLIRLTGRFLLLELFLKGQHAVPHLAGEAEGTGMFRPVSVIDQCLLQFQKGLTHLIRRLPPLPQCPQ